MKVSIITVLITIALSIGNTMAKPNNGSNVNSEYLISNGETLYGNTEVNLDFNDAILRNGRNIVHYPSNQIEKVAVLEGTKNELQLYYSGMFGLNKKQYLFKILSEGRRTLLFRQGLKFSDYEEQEYPPFYVLANGQIFSLSTNKKEMTRQIDGQYQKELLAYIKNNQLDTGDSKDLAELFDFYNVLVESK